MDSLVNILTRLRTGRSDDRIPARARHFSLLQNVQTGCGIHPALYSIHTGVTTDKNRLELDTDHSFPSSAEGQGVDRDLSLNTGNVSYRSVQNPSSRRLPPKYQKAVTLTIILSIYMEFHVTVKLHT